MAAGADVNAKNAIDETPLDLAAMNGYKETAELLIANGADVNVKSKFGKTPLDLAIIAGTPKVSDLLRKHGGKMWKELKAAGN